MELYFVVSYVLSGVGAYWSMGGYVGRDELVRRYGGTRYYTGTYRTWMVKSVPIHERLLWSALGPIGFVRGFFHIIAG
ncbi:MAG: hypothetical protein ACREGB_00800 [Candidatus Saccharimonadales bacterium]